jgi:lipid-A-disaccharide synthase
MKYYVIAGEASGDLHGANLIKEIKEKDPNFDCRAWGGDRMEKEGADIVKHYKELAFMGFAEVVANLRTIFKNIKFCKEDILKYKPDVVILIDYPGFNLRIADFLKENNIKVFYYISPQVWAWKQSRVKKIKKVVDRMFVILPFEKPFYEKFDYKVDFLGHPLLDEVKRFKESSLTAHEFKQQNNLSEKKIIALLPGSRTQEIKKKLPIMLSVVKSYPQYQFVIAGAPSQEEAFYNEITQDFDVPVIHGKTYNLLNNSYAALVTSGTATLETALFRVPQVVCYKGSSISYQIAKRLIKVDYISLVNLILNKEAVNELIQGDLNTENLLHELTLIVQEGDKREKVLKDYDELISILGGAGASGKVADLMLTYLKA